MDANVLVALISASSSGLVAITALFLNYRGFSAIDARFTALESTVNARFNAIDARFNHMDTRIDVLIEKVSGNWRRA